MIYLLTNQVDANFTTRAQKLGSPLKVNVFYGDERLDRKNIPENSVQVLEAGKGRFEYSSGDTIKMVEPVVAKVQAVDTAPGASQNRNRRLAKQIAAIFMILWIEAAHAHKCTVRDISFDIQHSAQATEIGSSILVTFLVAHGTPALAEIFAAASQVAQTSTTVGQSDGAGGITGVENSCG